jgi:hypothetical protein
MSADFDGPPIYDSLIKGEINYLNDIWASWIATFVQTLSEYLTKYGIFIPRLTTAQRNEIQSPQEGQMIYNTTILAPQIWQNGAWRTFTTF